MLWSTMESGIILIFLCNIEYFIDRETGCIHVVSKGLLLFKESLPCEVSLAHKMCSHNLQNGAFKAAGGRVTYFK